MADIFKFQGEPNEEEYCCEACQVTDEYLEIALECETPDELRITLRNLYEDAQLHGYKDALHQDIGVKIDIIDELEGRKFEG